MLAVSILRFGYSTGLVAEAWGAFWCQLEGVEPRVGRRRPTVLRGWPRGAGGLARAGKGDPDFTERWEAYVGGVELCNAYSELTDPVEQRRRFKEEIARRERDGDEPYPIDERFMSALEGGMAACAGAALGLDRLLMLLLGLEHVDQTVTYPPEWN